MTETQEPTASDYLIAKCIVDLSNTFNAFEGRGLLREDQVVAVVANFVALVAYSCDDSSDALAEIAEFAAKKLPDYQLYFDQAGSA